LVYASGYIKTSDQANSQNIEYKNPKWEDSKLFIPSKKSPLLKIFSEPSCHIRLTREKPEHHLSGPIMGDRDYIQGIIHITF